MSTEILSCLSWDDNDGCKGLNPLFPKKIRCLVCGPSGSGKTQFVLNMILQDWVPFNDLVIVTPSLFQTMYQVLIKGIQNGLPLQWIINIFKEKESIKGSGLSIDYVIEKLGRDAPTSTRQVSSYESISEMPQIEDLRPGTLVIFDDLMLDRNAVKRAEELFTRGRPMDINIIFISQSYYEVPRRTIRENCNFLVLFQQNKKSLESLYRDEAAVDMNKDEFDAFCKDAWRERHSFLVVDKSSQPAEGKYRIGVNKFYIPKSYL